MRLSNFVGEFGLAAQDTSEVHTTLCICCITYQPCSAGLETMPSLSDVRRVVTEYCILPM